MGKSMTRRGKSVNKKTLADFLGHDPKAVDYWLLKGCPYVTRADKATNTPWEFDTAEVVQWLQAQAEEKALGDTKEIDESDARKRKAAAEAAMAELQLGKMRGQLLDAQEVQKAGVDAFTACKTRLLAIPSKMAPIVSAIGDVNENRKELEMEIHRALNELAGYAAPESDFEPDEGDSTDLA